MPHQFSSFSRTLSSSAALLLTSCLLFLSVSLGAVTTIYVNNGGSDNNPGTRSAPVKTLLRAKQLIENQYRSKPSTEQYEILLAGGQTFEGFAPQTNQLLIDFDAARSTFAFVWDINRQLRLSTYGDNSKATLIGDRYTYQGGPTNCIAVVAPSTRQVEIRNLRIQRFQVGAIFIHETRNVIVRDNEVSEIGTLYFPDEQDDDIYCAGVIYPRNSTNITVRGNTIRNCHNQRAFKQELHGVYMTRLGNSSVFDNTLVNISGSALKVRRQIRSRDAPNNIAIYNNDFIHTSISDQTQNVVQRGWMRLSGDSPDNCAYGISIYDNKFYYPFCDTEIEDCGSARARKCSVSNGQACGPDGCDTRIDWTNNDYRYSWARPAAYANPVTLLRAENRNVQSGTQTENEHPGYYGSGYVNFGGPGTFIEWSRVNGEGGGRRRFEIRYANGSGSSRRCHLRVDGQYIGAVSFPPTGSWQTWKTAQVWGDLPHGDHVIRLTASPGYDGPNVDQIRIVDATPSSSATTSSFRAPLEAPATGTVSVFPNPTSGQLTFAYELAQPQRVNIALFDLFGRRVAQVVDSEQSAGPQRIRWHARAATGGALPAGSYVYRIQTADRQYQGSLVLR
ncbi:hypothetical protein LEM8419_02543 [Neolewinella maritima]|uniref:CBM6 domain-containing protein n=1 Tax=Neolewinella maritima TaxID=1383882 RepID=A0ABM9B2R9_9BACT|nr:carbohydrate-binding protein [Neolewinella maritima]CAH1001638.1 hypothetical protein LEM8419_02543 [Neolewinella maritima]